MLAWRRPRFITWYQAPGYSSLLRGRDMGVSIAYSRLMVKCSPDPPFIMRRVVSAKRYLAGYISSIELSTHGGRLQVLRQFLEAGSADG